MEKINNHKVTIDRRNSIVFQVVALNVAMLVAFVAVLAVLTGDMATTNTSSKKVFNSMLSLSTEQQKLKNDIMSMYDETLGYISATAEETREALKPEIEKASKKSRERHKQNRSRFWKRRRREGTDIRNKSSVQKVFGPA